MTINKLITAIALFMTSCVTPFILPSEIDSLRAKEEGKNVPLQALLEAHELYSQKCGNCHYLYRPYQFTTEKWAKIMPEMKDDAKLTNDEYNQLYDYVMIMQKANPLNK